MIYCSHKNKFLIIWYFIHQIVVYSHIHSIINRCTCGHCHPMPTNAESVCCKEIQQVCAVINEEEPEKRCITELTSFAPACLQRTVLRIAYYSYRQHYEEISESNG